MRQKKRFNKHTDILLILISFFVVVAAWVGFNIYHVYVTSTISQEIQVQLAPIDPEFNNQTIQSLKSRERVNPSFEKQPVASSAARTPSIEPERQASVSGELQPTETQTQIPTIRGQ